MDTIIARPGNRKIPTKNGAFSTTDWAVSLIDQIPDLACLCRHGEIVHINNAGLQILGLKSAKRMQGRQFSEFLHTDYRDIVDQLLGRKFVEQSPFSVKFQRGRQSSIDAEIIVSPIGTEKTGLTTVFARDITDRIRITKSLLRSENRYRNLVEKALNLICICEDGYITYINAAGAKMLHEQTPATMFGRRLDTLFHPDYREVLEDGLGLLVAEIDNLSGNGSSLPIKMVCVDADVIDVELAVIPIGGSAEDIFMIEAHDITRRLQATRSIREREQLLQGIMNSVADAIVTTDDQGIVQSYNPAAEQMFGYLATDIVGKSINLIIPDNYSGKHNQNYRNYRNTGITKIIGDKDRQLEGKKADGTVFPIELSVTELRLGVEQYFTGIIHDITERKRAADQLRRAHDDLEIRVEERTAELTQEIIERKNVEKNLQLAAEVIANLTEAVVIVDRNFKISSVNPAFSEITGYGARNIIDKRPPFFKALKKDRDLFARMNRELKAKGYWEGELWTTKQNGQKYAIRISMSALVIDDNKELQYAIVFNDITKRKQDEERIYIQANYDPLTDLPNRILFQDRLHQSLFAMARSKRNLGLMFLDLDGFKEVNDTYGHDVGDLLLQEAGCRLLDCVRDGDTVARLGGDEFTVIMPNLTDPKDARLLAQRILDTISEPYLLKGKQSTVSASIGVTIYPGDATEAGELVKNADVAMYRAKENGKANYQFFTADLNQEIQERLVLKSSLASALENGEFELHYQPKVNIKTGKISGVEALMRWNSSTLGPVSPVKFIPILEETGLIIEVGAWALRIACQQHKKWIKEGLPPIRVAVNLSARQLREKSFVKDIVKIMKETGATPESLEVEITESMVMSDASNAVAALMKLNDLGLHIAMDDFGTGYSSLSYLKNFPIHTIKIDRSFVSDITTSNDDTALIQTIIQYSQNTNRKVIAEGVETKEQLSILKKHNCDEIQGYYISKPLPADELTVFMKNLKLKI